MLGGARTFFKVVSVVHIVYGGALILSCCYVMLAFIGTTFRSLLINSIIMPYAKMLLVFASRTASALSKGWRNLVQLAASS